VKTFDVAIIGAGPAGAVAAVRCARSGLKTVVVEKKSLPRSKSCAGGLTAKCIRLLRDIDCFNDRWLQRSINQLMIHYPLTGRSCELISTEPYLGTVLRPDFDMALANLAVEAGATIRESESFISYELKPGGLIEIQTDQSAIVTRILIGADGFFSRVRKQMFHKMGMAISNPMMFGIECDVPIEQINSLSTDYCHLFFNIGKQINYAWAFPKKDVVNIGMVLDAGKGSKTIQLARPVHLIKIFLQKISGKNILWKHVGAAPIPLFDDSLKPTIQKDNVLLIGDAAGFADAWTGEGIYFGVKSAVLAHRVVQNAMVDGKQIECLSSYSKLCNKYIFNELKMSYRVSGMFKKFPSLYDYLQYPKVRQLFVPHTQGKISYQKAVMKAFLLVSGYKLRLFNHHPVQ
jgi:geranylgeranyl reductase family protein